MTALISTTGDLCTFVLRASGINGVGQTPMAEDSNTCLQALVNLLAQWQRKRWLVYTEQETSLTSTGAQSYTIGPGGDFDTPRPERLHAAYVRILGAAGPNLVDMPLAIITSREDYASITVKSIVSFPSAVFYDSTFPLGRVYYWPVPPANAYGLYLTTKAPLPAYTSLTDPINLPDEYMEALIWSLCIRMQMMYGLPARPDHAMAMRQAMNTIRQANTQIPELAIPIPWTHGHGSDAGLVGPGLGRAYVLDSGPALS